MSEAAITQNEQSTAQAEPSRPTPADQSTSNGKAHTNSPSGLYEPESWPGPYLRLTPLNLSALPPHDRTLTAGEPENQLSIKSHVYSILSEARQLANRISDKDGWKHTGAKAYKTVSAPIENWKSEVTREEIISANQTSPLRDWKEYKGDTEYWFARKSLHKDAAESGTASWAEFVAGLRDDHSINEKSYTPSIYDARFILDFEQALSEAGLHNEFQGLTMKIYEMCHDVPLRNRTFATLVLTASISDNEFIVAQFPVQLKGSDIGFYSNNKNHDPNNKTLDAQMKKTVTIGQYVSIERVIRRPELEEVEWLMATASDAKGGIPMMLQRPAIPGTICKDVEYFMKWTAERRHTAPSSGEGGQA